MQTSDAKEIVQKMQKIVYGILCDIDDFCKERNIQYYLSGGTALGAVRHHGFIPWDDDADIMLPRKEYDRFIREFTEAYSGKYGIGELTVDPEWNFQYARIWDLHSRVISENLGWMDVGIAIDVFPIDGLPENGLVRKIYYGRIRLLSFLANTCIKKKFMDAEKLRFLKTLIQAAVKPFGARFFVKKMDRLARKYDFDKCRLVGVSLAAHYGSRETIPRTHMETAVYLPFVDRELPVPAGYDVYLSNLYGDYMTIPKDAQENGYSHLDHWTVIFGDEETNAAAPSAAEN